MRSFAFDVELLDDVVVSASGATAGGHRCLDYLPGSLFLGAAAARLYAALGPDAFTVFHSGRVRFLPAFPLASGNTPTLPLPRSFHAEKHGSFSFGGGWLPGAATHDLQNLSRPGAEPGREMDRPEQAKEGFFAETTGTLVHPAKQREFKTAIDPATGRASESQLFGYEALCAGARFRAEVQVDDDVPPEIDTRLAEALCATELRLGRSKRKEFGRARTSPRREAAPPAAGQPADGLLLLYFRSDVALTDPDTGQPTLAPRGEHFGLPGAEIVWEQTFLRTRRYSPINAKRVRPDLERQVLAQGSVLALRPAEVPEGALARLAAGVGAYRSEGLGQLLVEPPFLAARRPCFPGSVTVTSAAAPPPPALDHPLQRWAEEGAGRRRQREDAYAKAGEWLKDERFARKAARPGRSQWGLVRERATLARDAEALRRDLFGDGAEDRGLLRRGVRREAWQDVVEAFQERVQDCPTELCREAVILLAGRLQKELQKEDRR